LQEFNEARSQFKAARAELFLPLAPRGAAAYQNGQTPPSGTVEYKDAYGVGNLQWELDIWGITQESQRIGQSPNVFPGTV